MSIANPLWGTPRIHGELLKLGINVGQTTVAKYMTKTRRPHLLQSLDRRKMTDFVVTPAVLMPITGPGGETDWLIAS
jgi:hypothetical protein